MLEGGRSEQLERDLAEAVEQRSEPIRGSDTAEL
jgi:hypothetical protein